jgi:hypothetical protein
MELRWNHQSAKGLPFSSFEGRDVRETVPRPRDSPPGSVVALRLHLPLFVRALRNRELSTTMNGIVCRLDVERNEGNGAVRLTLRARSVSFPANQIPHC